MSNDDDLSTTNSLDKVFEVNQENSKQFHRYIQSKKKYRNEYSDNPVNIYENSNDENTTDTADNPGVEEVVSYCEFLPSEVVDPMGNNGEYSCPAISVLPSGLAVVMATEATEGKTWMRI